MRLLVSHLIKSIWFSLSRTRTNWGKRDQDKKKNKKKIKGKEGILHFFPIVSGRLDYVFGTSFIASPKPVYKNICNLRINSLKVLFRDNQYRKV